MSTSEPFDRPVRLERDPDLSQETWRTLWITTAAMFMAVLAFIAALLGLALVEESWVLDHRLLWSGLIGLAAGLLVWLNGMWIRRT